jgi:hypothetical protein
VLARGEVEHVAVSSDGRQVVWVDRVPRAGWTDRVPDVVVATADGREIKRLPDRTDPCPNSTPGGPCVTFTWPNGLAVIGDQLLITSSCESDDGCTLEQLDLRKATTWSGREIRPRYSDRRYKAYDNIGAGTATTAVVEERGSMFYGDAPPSRAVLVDLATSGVLTVIATAAEGRFIARVSGGLRGWAYTTATSTDDHGNPVGARHYARLPGEGKGAPLIGLPSDVVQIAAA